MQTDDPPAGRPTPRGIALGASGLVVAALLCIKGLGHEPPAWYPPCLFHAWTGWHCPGCGAARAIHALMQGEWLAALSQNALAVLVAPWLVHWAGEAWWRAVRHGRAARVAPTGAAIVFLVVVLAFAVARNLPWAPFAWLAPGV